MNEITELDNLLNTLETSSLEPHGEYSMGFTNHEQTLIWNYIKDLKKKNQQLKSQLEKEKQKTSSVLKDCVFKTLDEYKNYFKDYTRDQILKESYFEHCAYIYSIQCGSQISKVLEEIEKLIYSYGDYKYIELNAKVFKQELLSILNKRGGTDE